MRKHLQAFCVFILCSLLLVACGTTASGTTNTPASPAPTNITLNVFVAASLKESFNAIVTNYHQAHPNITITPSYNGSQILEQQIAGGAPADVFASADEANMQKAISAGVVSDFQPFVKNILTVIIPANNPGNISSLKDLARKGVKIDMGAATLPAGKYSQQVLDKMSRSPDYGPAYTNTVKANVVSQETDVKAVVNKVQLGEADAGFVYVTDVTSAVSGKVKMIVIPDNFNVVAQYYIAVIKNSAHASAAQSFVQYILSPAGQDVLKRFHFTVLHA